MEGVEPKYEQPNGRATLGEVNRNVLLLRDELKCYIATHEVRHATLAAAWESDKRWLITALISGVGLAAILHTALG
jgi:hypothetical protein